MQVMRGVPTDRAASEMAVAGDVVVAAVAHCCQQWILLLLLLLVVVVVRDCAGCR